MATTITTLMQTVNSATGTYITSSVQSVMGYISGPFYALMGVYIALWGFAHFMGLIKEPISDAVKRFLKIFAIMTMALHFGSYNDYVVTIFTKVPEDLAGVFLAGTGTGATISNAGNVVTALDDLFGKLWELGDLFWKQGRLAALPPNLMPYFVALMVYVLTVCITAYAAFLIVLSKIALAVLIGIGPLFIMGTLFETTKKFFESWLGFLCNYALVMVLTVAVSGLFISIVNQFYAAAQAGIADDSSFNIAAFAPVAITCIVGLLLFPQIMGIASSLGGGVSLSTMGAPGKALDAAKGTAKYAAKTPGAAVDAYKGAKRVKSWAQSKLSSTASEG